MIRRYGENAVAGRRYELRPGAYAILPRDGQLLLTYQGGMFSEFQLPGGGIDPGESPMQALYREVLEETGWRIATPRRLGAFRRFTYMPEYDRWAEKLCHIFLAQPVRCHGKPSEPDHTAVWAEPDVAMDVLCNEGDRDFVANLFG